MAYFWTEERLSILRNLCKAGKSNAVCADVLGCETDSVRGAKYRYSIKTAEALPEVPLESFNDVTEGDVRNVTSESPKIKTAEDLLRHINADLTQFDVVSKGARKWDSMVKGPNGTPIITQMFSVNVKLKAKTGITTREAIDAILTSAFKAYRPPTHKIHKPSTADLPWNAIPIFDPHFGKYAWAKSTGGKDYDLDITQKLIQKSAHELIDASNDIHGPARRTIILGGDVFHYDTPAGTTTAGTPLDRDGRLQKMIEIACDTILGIVEYSAEYTPTDVVLVNGNHDTAMSWAFQRILQERFRSDERVTIDPGYTSRKFLTYGKNLLGVAHGDKARKRLPQVMALEAPKLWGASTYREIHTGHLHYQSAERNMIIDTIDGVIVRIAPAMCPPDDWHAEKGFLGALQAMESFHYVPDGGLLEMRLAKA